MVFNGAALVASDCGDSELARTWCHQHANLYLSQAPLNGHTARYALEPVINLARLRIRDGDSDTAYRQLTDLHAAITGGRHAIIDGLEIHPEQLTTDAGDLKKIITWLRGVLLSDGTRALTRAGRWADALAHVHHHDGLGTTLLDGRQVAVVAHLMQGDAAEAVALLRQTNFEQPWEQAVHDLLQRWHAATTLDSFTTDDARLIERALTAIQGREFPLFRVRLLLTTLDLIVDTPQHVTADFVNALVADIVRDGDGNAARDLLGHPSVSSEHHGPLGLLVEASGLGRGSLPHLPHESLTAAVAKAGIVIGDTPSAPYSKL